MDGNCRTQPDAVILTNGNGLCQLLFTALAHTTVTVPALVCAELLLGDVPLSLGH